LARNAQLLADALLPLVFGAADRIAMRLKRIVAFVLQTDA